MKNSGFPIGKHYILQNRYFQEKLEKSLKKPPKILPKSTPNPSKIGKKSINIDQKSDADLRCAKKAKKMLKNAKKWPKTLPKGAILKPRRDTRSLLRRGRSPSQGRTGGRLVNSHLTRWWVQDPCALGRFAGLCETARGS